MVKRIETEEAKTKLTVLIPKSVREAIKQEAELADESQSLFICTLLELYQTLGSATAIQPVVDEVQVPLPASPVPVPPVPQVPRIGAMKQMEQSLEGGYGGQSEATRMLQLRLQKEQRGGTIERIRRQSEAAGKSEE